MKKGLGLFLLGAVLSASAWSAPLMVCQNPDLFSPEAGKKGLMFVIDKVGITGYGAFLNEIAYSTDTEGSIKQVANNLQCKKGEKGTLSCSDANLADAGYRIDLTVDSVDGANKGRQHGHRVKAEVFEITFAGAKSLEVLSCNHAQKRKRHTRKEK